MPCSGVLCSGICTDISNDPDHCGSCSTICSDLNATRRCLSGICAPLCRGGFSDCDANGANGCETIGSCGP
jgi:hypothetical protein